MTRDPDLEALEGRDLADGVEQETERADRALGRSNLVSVAIAALAVLVLAIGAVVISRQYPPPSPPDVATRQQLDALQDNYDTYLAEARARRDAQKAQQDAAIEARRLEVCDLVAIVAPLTTDPRVAAIAKSARCA